MVPANGYISDLVPQNIYFWYLNTSEPPEMMSTAVDTVKNVTCGSLDIDQTCIIVHSYLDYPVTFQYQSMECENCPLTGALHVPKNSSKKVVLDFASLGTVWKVISESNKTLCGDSQYFGENSWYNLLINITNQTNCELKQVKEPEFIFAPIIVAIAVYILLCVSWTTCKYLYRKGICSSRFQSGDITNETSDAINSSPSNMEKSAKQRLRSLDTVRGIAIVVMIFVNYGGGNYWFFDHALWNGLTVADLVFPWFIWMMGMSTALSLHSLLRKGVPRKIIFCKILIRTAKLFALGLMLNTYCSVVDIKFIRIPGVLQRFSISYFVVGTVHLLLVKTEDPNQGATCISLQDLISNWLEWIIMLLLLATHILLTFFLYVPGCPRGYLGPGGHHDGGKYNLCTGGAAGFIDRELLGVDHLYKRPSFMPIYQNSLPYDPEGILGFLTSIFLVFLGLQAGNILFKYQDWRSRILRWISWAVILGAISLILCKASKNDGWIPINKNLWSVSFIFATGSLAFILMSVCYFTIDVKKWWSGAPFFYSGMNSILLYVGHTLTHNMFPWSWKVPSTHADQLFIDLWGTSLWVIISIWMFHINFFVTV